MIKYIIHKKQKWLAISNQRMKIREEETMLYVVMLHIFIIFGIEHFSFSLVRQSC